jgi:hypothetical protein
MYTPTRRTVQSCCSARRHALVAAPAAAPTRARLLPKILKSRRPGIAQTFPQEKKTLAVSNNK